MVPAVDMLMRRIYPGKLSTFTQFNTFRSSWSYFSTVWKASIKGVSEGDSFEEDHIRNTVLTKCSTHTIFLKICERRRAAGWKQVEARPDN